MIPYIDEPTINLGSYTLRAFAVLVCAAVLVGFEIVVRRAPRVGLDRETAASLVTWTLFWGFVISHWFDLLAYYPETVRENPLELLAIWSSMSSFGGICGGIAGAVLVMRRRGLSGIEMSRFIDLVAFAFPFAWLFGRAGCSLAHDHIGVLSQHWLAVGFPGGARFDLGLLEFLYTIPIAFLFFALRKRTLPAPFFMGLFFTLYGPVRFFLDTLRAEDARYLGWTPGQFLSIAFALVGPMLLVHAFRSNRGSVQRASEENPEETA